MTVRKNEPDAIDWGAFDRGVVETWGQKHDGSWQHIATAPYDPRATLDAIRAEMQALPHVSFAPMPYEMARRARRILLRPMKIERRRERMARKRRRGWA